MSLRSCASGTPTCAADVRDGWLGEARSAEQVPLAVLRAGIAHRAQLIAGFDSLGHDLRSQLPAQAHNSRDELVLARIAVKVLDELSVEFDELGGEVADELQVRVPSAEIVHDEVNARTSAGRR